MTYTSSGEHSGGNKYSPVGFVPNRNISKNLGFMNWGMAQGIRHLPGKHETWVQIPRTHLKG